MSTPGDKQAALYYHQQAPAGKLGVYPTKPLQTQADLALAYSPGVAEPCRAIAEDRQKVFDYTAKGNLVAVISNGTAVLGLGNIGPEASKPVMEGKAILFKKLAGIDAFDIELDETDPTAIIQIIKSLSPTFGGINLEDIKAPECFQIEEALKAQLSIPVMHDDQHGTAIISAAALLNALEVAQKDIADIQLVVSGAGAGAIACTQLYLTLGVKKENIVMCDSKGVIRKGRTDINTYKATFATDRPLYTLTDALKGADVFLGLSVANQPTYSPWLSTLSSSLWPIPIRK
jgi:malic enzyme